MKEELQYVKTWGLRWIDDWDRPTVRGMTPRANSRANQRQIILIRHGQYEKEASHDDSIRRLTPLGEEQARRTGQYLHASFEAAKVARVATEARRNARQLLKMAEKADNKELLAPIEHQYDEALRAELSLGSFLVHSFPQSIFVSDLTRANQTADLILEAFPEDVRQRVTIDPMLRETFPCDPQPSYRRSHASPESMKIVEEAFEKYFHRPAGDESSVEIIVGHANVIRYLTLRALQLPPEAWLRTSLPHCSITNLVINGEGHVKLSGMGSFGHLPPDMVTVRNIS